MLILAIHPTIAILILMIGAAILGGIIGYLLRKPGSDQEGINQENTRLKAQIQKLKTQLSASGSTTADLAKCQQEYADLKLALTEAEQKILELHAGSLDLADCQKQNDGLKRQLAYAEQKIIELEAKLKGQGGSGGEVEALQAELKKQTQKNADQQQRLEEILADLKACQGMTGNLGAEVKQLTADLGKQMEMNTALQADLEAEKTKGGGIRIEIQRVQADLDACHTENKELKSRLGEAKEDLNETKKALTKEEERAQKLAEMASRKGEIDFGIIGVALPDHKDDLKVISGVGPFIEEKLNILDIYTYEQIAAFTPRIIDKVQSIIEFFPGRIERDDWVGQAKALSGNKNKDT